MRSSKRQNLTQLIDDIPQSQITAKNRKELHLLAIEGNELLISAYEVFAVDLDRAELYETLLMIISGGMNSEECCGVNTSEIDREFVEIIRDVVYDRKIMSSQIGEAVLRLMQADDKFIVAAFQVYKENENLSEFLDTVGRVVRIVRNRISEKLNEYDYSLLKCLLIFIKYMTVSLTYTCYDRTHRYRDVFKMHSPRNV
jgi:hypothetical protein